MTTFPNKLKPGDEVRVIAPSRSLSGVPEAERDRAVEKLSTLGLKVSFGKNALQKNYFESSIVQSRVDDIHDAFRDKNVKAILAARGGSNAIQLLKYLDYNLIKNNPKIFCGYSDITILQNAIYKMTELVTYSGPQFSSFEMQEGFEYTLDYFKKALFSNDAIEVKPSTMWSEKDWSSTNEKRYSYDNEGFWLINPGSATATIVGGNVSTFQLLQGTQYMPSLRGTILFLEADAMAGDHCVAEFDRMLESLLLQPGFDEVQGIVFGRFQSRFGMDVEMLKMIIDSKRELHNIPIVANADFGHTMPMITWPIGGRCELKISASSQSITILQH